MFALSLHKIAQKLQYVLLTVESLLQVFGIHTHCTGGQTDRTAYCHHLHYMNRFYIKYLHVYLYLLAVCFRENVSSHIKGPEKHDPNKP